MDIPDLHAISIAKFICAKPGIRRLYTTKSKIMHENGREGIQKHVENLPDKLEVKKASQEIKWPSFYEITMRSKTEIYN